MTKLKITCFFMLFLFHTEIGFSQNDLNVKELQTVAEDKNTVVHLSALWCLPCVKKLKADSDSLEENIDTVNKHIVVFDRRGFSWDRIERLDMKAFDTSFFYLIPKSAYSTAFIQFNPSNKGLKKYMKLIKHGFKGNPDFKEFWFGDKFIIKDKQIYYPIHSN